jgi:hypothetical protein
MAESKLKESTLSSHMRTLERASERVSSWPQWKRDTIQYRVSESGRSEALKCEGNAPKRQM